MAMAATYTTFAGMVVHQRKNGVDTELISDPLGSVVKTKDASGNETSRTEYWPYGEVQSSTGSNPTPFGFVGTLGYYRDLATRLYVRARYLRPDQGRWQTVDPHWPDESAYGYVGSLPNIYSDPTGEGGWDSQACQDAKDNALGKLKKCFSAKDSEVLAKVMMCIAFGESKCHGGGAGEAPNGTARGLYQLGCWQYNACIDADSGCKPCATKHVPGPGCSVSEVGCGSLAMMNFMIWATKGRRSLGDGLCRNFGVLPCPPLGRPNPQVPGTMECLNHFKIDIFHLPVPVPLPGSGCGCKSSPTLGKGE